MFEKPEDVKLNTVSQEQLENYFVFFYPVNHLDKSVLFFFFVELIQKKAENKKIQDEFNYYD